MSPLRVSRKFTTLFNSMVILILLAGVFAFPQPAQARVLIVNSVLDDDDGVCDSIHCTLREAINAARDGDIIWISIPTGSSTWEIVLESELPPITQSNLTIDATPMPPYMGGPSVVLVGSEDFHHGIRIEGSNNVIRGFQFRGFRASSIRRRETAGLISVGSHNIIEGNVFVNNTYGIILYSSHNVVRDNYIGLMPGGSGSPNDEAGVVIRNEFEGEANIIETNVIAYNGDAGIAYQGPVDDLTSNLFTRNSVFDNGGRGIHLGDLRFLIEAPILTDVGRREVSGEGCVGCTIELFIAAPDPSGYGEGQTFIGEGIVAGDGTFTILLDDPLSECDPVTATATTVSNETSEFSQNGLAGVCTTVEMPPSSEHYLTVNTVDYSDDGTCNEDHCSLLEAINFANRHLGRDVITFDIPGPGPHEILVSDFFPPLTDDQTVIDGASEPDYSGNPVVWIVNDGAWSNLYVRSQRNTVRGLGITGFVSDVSSGLSLAGNYNLVEDNVIVGNSGGISVGAAHNTFTGNYIGIMPDGTVEPNYQGIWIYGTRNQIGLPGDGNFISGNTTNGISMAASSHNSIMGNIIGSDPSLTVAVPNGGSGIRLEGSNSVGGLGSGEGNIIFGNRGNGISITPDTVTTFIAGNIIAQNGADGIALSEGRHFDGAITITQNSIYDNGELGIETNRVDDHVANLGTASFMSISGMVDCPSCTVELFLAAPDPTGYGEGQTYLGETTTEVDGSFTFEFSGLEACDQITATVTDATGQTSAFSQNALVACMRMPGRGLGAFGLGGLLILTIVVVILRRSNPQLPSWLVPGVAGGGLLVLVLVLGGVAVIPSVQLDFGPPNAPLPDPQPPCSQYLDPEGYAPGADQLFGLEEDPAMRWTPGADAPADAEWLVEVMAPDQRLYTLSTTETSMNLSAFQLEPRAGARFDWSVRMLEEGESACWPEAWQSLWFENPVIEAYEALPEAEADEPQDDEACTPTAVALMNATCRLGPSSDYAELGFLLEGDAAEILGRTADWTWWNVRLVEGQQVCWVSADLVEAECTDDLQVVAAPSLPTDTPTSPPPAADTTAPPVPSPISPTGGTTLACSSSALLNWSTVNDPSGISGYTVEVQRSSDQVNWSGNPGSPATVGDDKTTIQVDCGWYYRWRVRATDGEGNTSAFSNWATFAVTLN